MSAQKITREDVVKAQEAVMRIVGVQSCQIVTNSEDEIVEIHVVATAVKPAKFVARDVESCLKAVMGIDVDYRKIGVVIVGADPPAAPTQSPQPARDDKFEEFPIEEYGGRFCYRSVNLFLSHDGAKAEVELRRESAEAFGSASNQNPHTSPLQLIAEATLKAVSEYLDRDTRLCLGGVRKVTVDDTSAIVVKVELVSSRIHKDLAGCSIISGNENQTVVFAALDAVNRVLGKLEFKQAVEYRIQ